MSIRRTLRVAAGFLLLLGLAWHVEPKAMVEAFDRLQHGYVGVAAGLILMSTLIGAFNTHLLMNPEGRISFFNFLPIYWLAWAVGLVFPGQVGDIATLSAVMKRRGTNVSRTLGRGLVDKLISFFLMLSFAGWGLANIASIYSMRDIVAGATLLMFGMALTYHQRERFLGWLCRWQPSVARFTHDALHEMREVIRSHPVRTAMNAMLTIIKITMAGTAYLCLFLSLGYNNLDAWLVITLAAASSIVAYLPLSLNGIGTVEVAGLVLFGALGIAPADVLTGYLALRIVVLLSAWLPAALWLAASREMHGQALDKSGPG